MPLSKRVSYHIECRTLCKSTSPVILNKGLVSAARFSSVQARQPLMCYFTVSIILKGFFIALIILLSVSVMSKLQSCSSVCHVGGASG